MRQELIHTQGDGGDVEGVEGSGVNPMPPPQSMYGSAANAALMRSYEAVKEDCALLRKRYDDLVSSHSAAVNKLECSQVSKVLLLIANCLTQQRKRSGYLPTRPVQIFLVKRLKLHMVLWATLGQKVSRLRF